MQGNLILPADITNIVLTDTAEEALTCEFNATVNCFVHPRNLRGDFESLAKRFHANKYVGIVQLVEVLERFSGSEEEYIALEQIIKDLSFLKDYGRKGLVSVERNDVNKKHIPHHDERWDCGRVVILYTDPATKTVRPADATPLTRNWFAPSPENRRYSLKEQAQVFDLGKHSIVRFATKLDWWKFMQRMKDVKPFIHFGSIGDNRLMMREF